MPTAAELAALTAIRSKALALSVAASGLAADLAAFIARPPTGPAAPPVVVPPPPGPVGAFLPLKRAGRRLATSDGVLWIGRGTNFYMDSYASAGDTQMPAVSNLHVTAATAIAVEHAARGANWIRLPVNNDRSAGYLSRLKAVIDANAKAGLRTMLCPFGDVTWAPSASNGQLVADLWTLLGKPASVLLETVNEPNRIADGAWLAGNLSEIGVIRAAGYTSTIFVGCQNWCWSLPLAEARVLNAADGNLCFMSHRYAFDGSTIRGSGDAALWVAEWSAAPDLTVAVGEFGWFNGNGSRTSIAAWCGPMKDAMVKGLQDGWLAGALSWIWLWDQNSHVYATAPPPGEPSSGNRDWYAISRGAPWAWDQWGDAARDLWAKAAKVVG